ncbi:MAG: hypothetical protein HY720_31095 [Planctomycetes bacterium]|nr:hypothetical protein [Planctomycetota bacterium]
MPATLTRGMRTCGTVALSLLALVALFAGRGLAQGNSPESAALTLLESLRYRPIGSPMPGLTIAANADGMELLQDSIVVGALQVDRFEIGKPEANEDRAKVPFRWTARFDECSWLSNTRSWLKNHGEEESELADLERLSQVLKRHLESSQHRMYLVRGGDGRWDALSPIESPWGADSPALAAENLLHALGRGDVVEMTRMIGSASSDMAIELGPVQVPSAAFGGWLRIERFEADAPVEVKDPRGFTFTVRVRWAARVDVRECAKALLRAEQEMFPVADATPEDRARESEIAAEQAAELGSWVRGNPVVTVEVVRENLDRYCARVIR